MSYEGFGAYEWAVEYLHRWKAIELYEKAAGQKGPRAKRKKYESVEDLQGYKFTNRTCVGISLSPGELAIDLDADEAVALAPYFLPDTTMISGHPGRELTHWYYKLEGDDIDSRTTKFLDPTPLSNEKATLVEYMHTSDAHAKTIHMIILPPTPYDEPRKGLASWDKYEEGDTLVNGEVLFTRAGLVAAAAILARCWSDGQRNALTIALSGALIREKWSPDEIANFIRPIAQFAGDDEWENRLVQPATTANRGNTGQNFYGWPTVASIIGTPRAKRVQEWLAALHKAAGGKPPSASIPAYDVAQATYDENKDRFLFIEDGKGEWASYKLGTWVMGLPAELDIITAVYNVRAKIVAQTRGALPTKKRDVEEIVWFLRSMDAVRVSANDFDNDLYLLNGPDETHDLERGSTTPHDPTYRLCRQMPTRFDPFATCPLWLEQMERTWPDPEIRDYVQRAIGYSLQGTQNERCFFILHGDGRNGKSLFLRVIEMVLGITSHGYAQQVNTSTFSRASASEINSGLAKLRGVRLATVGEFPNKNMNGELIKAITGGESNTTRQLYKVTTEFPFRCKLWFSSNNKPGSTEGIDPAFWDRVHSIPCVAEFPNPDEEGNISEAVMLDRFRPEASGILNWMLEGHRAWREIGLAMPENLRLAREEYKAELDLVEQFLSEDGVEVHPMAKTCPDDVSWTELIKVWEVFDAWASRIGEDRRHRNQCRTKQEFKRALIQKGYTVKRPHASAKNPYSGQLSVYGINTPGMSRVE